MSLPSAGGAAPNGSSSAQRLAYRQRHAAADKRERRERVDAQTPDENTRRRRYYDSLSWARHSCCVCDNPRYVLHHGAYRVPWPREIGVMAPLCPYHHELFHVEQWPRLKRAGFTLTQATLFIAVHGHGGQLFLAATAGASPQLSLLDQEAS
jgi:hypothetical protein